VIYSQAPFGGFLIRVPRSGIALTAATGSPTEIPHPATRTRPRIESLSDLVFGLALSLGAFALVASPPSGAETLYSDLSVFGFSFLILIVVWLTYTRLIAGVALEDPRALALNIVLLFTVAIEPFLFDVLERPDLSSDFFSAVSQAYAIDVGVMMAVLGLFAWFLETDGKARPVPSARPSFRREAAYKWVVAGLFFASAAPIFAQTRVDGESVRVLTWYIAVGLLLIERLIRTLVDRAGASDRARRS
jgi:uncharacterized membrane protein